MLWHTELMFWCVCCSPCRVVVGVSVVAAKEMCRFSSSGMGVPATRHRLATRILQENGTCYHHHYLHIPTYRVIQKDGLKFVRLHFLNYTWYVNNPHNI
jgi:hypothetical protein